MACKVDQAVRRLATQQFVKSGSWPFVVAYSLHGRHLCRRDPLSKTAVEFVPVAVPAVAESNR